MSRLPANPLNTFAEAADLLTGCPDDEVAAECAAAVVKARAAVAELVEAVIAEREAREAAHVGNKQALMGEWRKSRERVRAALAKFGGAK